ncbi:MULTISPECIES: OmpA family protein [unclassified Massilia]|uniref:OmpA family protein n=1 Tax=unclassified Massilia TaxID=2609279 RepID=UPI001B815545|nr:MULTISPECIES: OmpA family protein [unclassified Massilia]MBQ5941690.1 OmpA family protein [Massilia sp. AB1]MBQ5962899.1 OmpA family protein [Massilia sp. ZL223]
MHSKLTKSAVAAALVALTASGCADMSATQRGTATGAGIGAGLGAIIGGTTSGGGSGRATRGAVIGGAAGAVIGNIWSKRMEAQKQQMEQATRGTGVQVTQTQDNRLKLEIPSDVSFDTGRSDIKSNFQPVLERFAQTLQENPATTVTIIGHTDSTGTPDINQPLSVDRAARTRDYLSARGVNPNRITIEGRGEREPIASNNDASGRARNRRVEIYVAERAQG